MFCILQDCNKEKCHHCFPVKKCSYSHEFCKKNGMFKELDDKKPILVTGCAGFIGSHVCEKLLQMDYDVVGVDNMDPYYDIKIKIKNIEILQKYKAFTFLHEDIQTTNAIIDYCPQNVIHLASMAGVRTSIKEPDKYVNVNIKGFINILEQCVKMNITNLVYASSSSVYGINNLPFKESDLIESCNSPYAASKRCMEVFAQTYSQLYNINTLGLRFFTVYGPRGRPDMAPRKFLEAIQNGMEIEKYGDGNTSRDYTYIDDIVNGIISAMKNKHNKKCEVYNLGNSTPITLNAFIETCEKVCGKKANIIQKSIQPGDVPHTYACIDKAKQDLDYNPQIDLEDGLRKSLFQ